VFSKVHIPGIIRGQGITAKFVMIFLSLTLMPLIGLSIFLIYNYTQLWQVAEQGTQLLGETVIAESTAALRVLGENAIEREAAGVAGQVAIYLASQSEREDAVIRDDARLQEIAIQPVGETGYTLMFNRETQMMLFHITPQFAGNDIRIFKDELPAFWSIIADSLDGSSACGYYQWQEPDGSVNDKFMYVVPVGGTKYMVAATTYIHEFLMPSNEIRGKILSTLTATGQYVAEREHLLLYVSVAAIIALLILSMIIALLLARTVSKPIRLLTDCAVEISNGNLDLKVPVITSDEIGVLATQFNRMSAALKVSYATLEEKVEERTRLERRRADQLNQINEVGQKISSVMDIDLLLPSIVESMRSTFDYSNVSIFLLDSNNRQLKLKATAAAADDVTTDSQEDKRLAKRAVATGSSALSNELPGKLQKNVAGSELAVPIASAERLFGVLDIRSKESYAFDDLDVFTVETLADEVAIAIDNARLYQNTRDMATLEERNRLAREIHDTLAQGFTGIVLQLEAAELVRRDEHKVWEHLKIARQLARDSLNEARRSVWALKPQVLEQLSLSDSVLREAHDFTRINNIPVEIDIDDDIGNLSPDTETMMLRVCHESLANIAKHARAAKVNLSLKHSGHKVTLTVSDNGIGFNPDEAIDKGFGLRGMHERANLLNARLEIKSQPGQGTRVGVTIAGGG